MSRDTAKTMAELTTRIEQIDKMILRVKSCVPTAKANIESGSTSIVFIDDFSNCVNCSNASLDRTEWTGQSLAARYGAILQAAMHVLMQMRLLQKITLEREGTRLTAK
jgi:hypothetical protein